MPQIIDLDNNWQAVFLILENIVSLHPIIQTMGSKKRAKPFHLEKKKSNFSVLKCVL